MEEVFSEPGREEKFLDGEVLEDASTGPFESKRFVGLRSSHLRDFEQLEPRAQRDDVVDEVDVGDQVPLHRSHHNLQTREPLPRPSQCEDLLCADDEEVVREIECDVFKQGKRKQGFDGARQRHVTAHEVDRTRAQVHAAKLLLRKVCERAEGLGEATHAGEGVETNSRQLQLLAGDRYIVNDANESYQRCMI